MTGDTHCRVAKLALARLVTEERSILDPRWDAIEAGATLSDHFRVMWEPAEPGDDKKQLVHRCYVDSADPKDHGCVTRALDHAEGSIAFIEDYLSGALDDAYTEVEFLENLGMFLGVTSHHIADLCTPVHVGHHLDFRSLGYPSLARFHSKVERDIQRYAKNALPEPTEPLLVDLRAEYFWTIARDTYHHSFTCLEDVYREATDERIARMASQAISTAVAHTANVWHTVLTRTNITGRSWSSQPFHWRVDTADL